MESLKSITEYDKKKLEDLTAAVTAAFEIQQCPLGEDVLQEIKEGYDSDEQAKEVHEILSNILPVPKSQFSSNP
ncbi:uncharacterized protein KGF55_003971 [Candida pseudojiufengensis]|uniref:uncharacterized protein n=1 Tax=Candida pseudojiufengensis TaxID=497109 RepID=UPI0022245E5D|nr:uncharacterized protein KGF55_003971 [Candida pseudojiufengensis]KAI5961654.1 hypothetical protein KGF55_003971 [Candida pseudojiufengensis]